MLEYRQCKIEYERDMTKERETALLKKKIARRIHVAESQIKNMGIGRKSLDARKKPQLFYTYTVVFECQDEEGVLRKNRKNNNLVRHERQPDLQARIRNAREDGKGSGESERIVVVGSGPAGLLCGYFLAMCGKKPLIIERGGPIGERIEKVSKFWKEGTLDPDTNVAFGEGGAGTFSDGKLNTSVKDKTGRKKFILETFAEHGAPEEICYDAKPHIGTDELRGVIRSMRETIRENGGVYRFHTCLTGFLTEPVIRVQDEEQGNREPEEHGQPEKARRLAGICVRDEQGEERTILCDACVLAVGHSARDTFQMIRDAGIAMEQKPFAIGVRVQHPQKAINEMQYGFDEDGLPAADYKLTGKTSDGRGVYSFCMCPGGYVVNASSEEGMTAVNGMSCHARDSKSANSAVIVTVNEIDFGSTDVLAGVEFQRELERRAYAAGQGKIPVQRFEDFKSGHISRNIPGQSPCTKGGFVAADVKNLLPPFAADGIIEGMEQFGMKMKGFDDGDTLVMGTETRTSSPVRIVRDKGFESVDVAGLYPCGEGAGYAGGIMSAAMDGLRVAEQIIRRKGNEEEDEKQF